MFFFFNGMSTDARFRLTFVIKLTLQPKLPILETGYSRYSTNENLFSRHEAHEVGKYRGKQKRDTRNGRLVYFIKNSIRF